MFRIKSFAGAVAAGVICAAWGLAGSASAHTFQDLQNVEDEIVIAQSDLSYWQAQLDNTSEEVRYAEEQYHIADDACQNGPPTCSAEAYGSYMDALSGIALEVDEYSAGLSAVEMELSDLQAEYASIYHELYG